MNTITIENGSHKITLRRESGNHPWFDELGHAWTRSDATGGWFRIGGGKIRSIGESWADFETKILDPIKASETQRRETRRAFYAGFQCAISSMERIGEDDVAEEEGLDYFESRRHEASLFARDVAEGRA